AGKKMGDFYVWVGTPIRGRTIFFASPGPGSAGEWWRSSILRGIPDELVQSLDLGLLLLRAHDPPNGRPSIGGRLLLEELPRLLVRPEPSLGDRVEFGGLPLLVRIDAGLSSIRASKAWRPAALMSPRAVNSLTRLMFT